MPSNLEYSDERKRTLGLPKGEGNNAKDLTVQEAVAFARKHRDQFLRGVDALRRLPAQGTDNEYRTLQEELDRDAPDVSDLAWGHKYFHLIMPDKLDDFHSPDWQRFHLLKMLQLPPAGDGRYQWSCSKTFRSSDSTRRPYSELGHNLRG